MPENVDQKNSKYGYFLRSGIYDPVKHRWAFSKIVTDKSY